MWKRALTLAVGIVVIAAFGTGSRGADKEDAFGNKFTWDDGYPKKGTIFVPSPPPGFNLNAAVTNYSVVLANNWSVFKYVLSVYVYADAAGTQYNGQHDYEKTQTPPGWSDEQKWTILISGASFRVKHNVCTFTLNMYESQVDAGDRPPKEQPGIAFP